VAAPDLSHWLGLDQDLLLVVPDRDAAQDMVRRTGLSGFGVGVLGGPFPLLSDLDVLENAALGPMFHRGVSLRRMRRRLEPLARPLGLEGRLHALPPDLAPEERLPALMLRALADEARALLLPWPEPSRVLDADRLRQGLDPRPRLWVCCTRNNADAYTVLQLRTLSFSGT
jgi:predicted ABC-type transport system involved in lysophospholipase L1 biosynthesis ATPase subunit